MSVKSTLFGSLLLVGAAAANREIENAGGYQVVFDKTLDKLKKIGSNTSQIDNEKFSFPSDLVDDTAGRNFYMSFQFQRYQRRSIFDQMFVKHVGGIRLPIPLQLTNRQSVDYEGINNKDNPTVGATIDSMIAQSSGAAAKIGSGAASVLASLGQGITTTTLNAAGRLAGTQNLSGQLFGLVGLTQNPYLTVLFNTPSFRRFEFSWRLAPTNADETERLKNLINKFTYHQLPDLAPSTAGTLLQYPDMVNIQLFPNDEYLFKFKPCVIESMSVAYVPANSPAFFKGTNAPVQVEFSISLLEIELNLKSNLNGSAATASYL
jgi:hypothetical protein